MAGGTYKEQLISLRKILNSAPFLIPGFGSQGGTIEAARAGLVKDDGFNNIFNMGIVNSSRGLCFPKEAKNCINIKEWQKLIENNLLKTSKNLKLKKI